MAPSAGAAGLRGLPMRLFRGEKVEPTVIRCRHRSVVRKQLELGIDCVGDGEFWKVRNFAYLSRTSRHRDERSNRRACVDSVFTRERGRVRAVQQGSRRHRHDLPLSRRKTDAGRARRAIVTADQAQGHRGVAQEIDTFKAPLSGGRAVTRRSLRDCIPAGRSLHLQRQQR